jgi:hypothetical protein
MLHAAKDILTSRAARTYLNTAIARYGKVEELTIDSKQRRARAVCLLDGEATPVTVEIQSYKIHTVDGRRFVEVEACRCSRRWIETLIIDHVQGKRYELPAWAAAAL